MNKSTQIKSLISTSMAVLLLLIYSLSGFVSSNSAQVEKSKTEKSAKSNSDKQTEINQDQGLLAVNSSLSVDTHFEPFSFPNLISFQFVTKKVFKPLQVFERNLYLKILFEHLIAPNAP